MHKCSNCGQEFNGNYCSNCGTPTRATAKPLHSMGEQLKKLFMLLKYIPVFVFGLFAIILFISYATPVMITPAQEFMGEKIPSESYGSVYSIFSGMSEELSEMKNVSLVLMLLAFVTFIFTFIYFFKSYENNIANPIESKLPHKLPSTYFSFVLYLTFFVIGCVICGKISAMDEGMDVIAAGACPILMTVFSAVCSLISLSSIMALILINKKYTT